MKFETFDFDINYSVEDISKTTIETEYTFAGKQTNKVEGDLNWDVESDSSASLTAQISINNREWSGRFEPGIDGISGFFATPNPDVLCVVWKGQGYWVPVLDPQSYSLLPCFPIKEILIVPNAKVLLFVDFLEVYLFGDQGMLWRSNRITWDGIEVNAVTTEYVRGMARDPSTDQEVPFEIDIKTGNVTGGVSF